MIDWSSPMEEKEIDWASPLNPSKKPESLKEKVLRYGVKGPTASVAKFGNQLLNVPSNIASLTGAKGVSKALSYKPDYDYRAALGLPAEQNIADMAIGLAPDVLGAIALPAANLGKAGAAIGNIPKAGKYISKILSEGLPQAGYAALMNQPEHAREAAAIAGVTQAPFSALSQLATSPKPQYQKIASLLGGALGGGLGTYTLNELGAPGYVSGPAGFALGALGAKGLGTKGMMMAEHAGGKNSELAQERMKMAKRLNLDFLTPEEAFNSPFLARKQGRLGKTEEGSELIYDKFQKRVESEQSAINRVLKQIHDPDIMGPKAEKLYKESYATVIPPESLLEFAKNPLIEAAVRKIETNEAYQHALEDVPMNTIEYLDHVKQALDDMIQGAPDKEARIIRGVKNSLVKHLDDFSPEYRQARGLEERKFARKELENAFDKTNINSGHAFYKALNSKEDFEKLMHNLRNVPIARAKLKYMRELFKDFRKESTINKVRGLEQTGMKQNRNAVDQLMHIFENMFSGGKFDKEAINFITSKNWDKQLEEINKITDKQKRMAKVIEVFGKALSQANAKQEPFMSNAKQEPFMSTENYDIYE